MLKETVILYPAPAIDHLVSMVELGKLILLHNPNFFVTVLVPSMPSQHDTFSSYIKLISETNNTLITFYPLPSLTLPNDPDHQNPVALACEFMRLNVPNVISALETISISSSSSILALITSAIVTDASYHPKIPTYHYYTSCASSLAFMLHFPTLDSQISPQSFRDLGSSIVQIPGLQPIIKACHVPEPLLDRNQGYDEFLNFATYLPKADGLILNTFNCLEARAIEAISLTIPTLYCVGPIVADAKDRSSVSRNASLDCLSWLDKQPSRSVVFLCFGSRGTFCETQIKQIAIGLERSHQRFLWVVKSPLGNTQNQEPNIEELLPEGFLERNKDRGLVVKSWAPQALVLNHEAIGGFVTHCGWNSVLEAVTAGVPMATWPLYAEQKMNSIVLVEEMNMAKALNQELNELVSSDEVERGVKRLMRSADGEALRKRSLDMKGMAQAAWNAPGGSSFDTLSKLVSSWKHNMT